MLHFALSSAMTGFMLGAAVPLIWGVWLWHDFAAHTAEPLPPGVGHCGMPALGAMFLILFGWPFGGAIGAVLGFTIGAISGCVLKRSSL
jgi:hypothetical protein